MDMTYYMADRILIWIWQILLYGRQDSHMNMAHYINDRQNPHMTYYINRMTDIMFIRSHIS